MCQYTSNETELGMEKQEKSELLVRDKEYVKYVQLLKKAEKDGRLDGTFECGLCGMKYPNREGADDCCRITVT